MVCQGSREKRNLYSVKAVEELGGGRFKGLDEAKERCEPNLPGAPLYTRHLDCRKPGLVRKFFLRPPARLALTSDVLAEALYRLLHAENRPSG